MTLKIVFLLRIENIQQATLKEKPLLFLYLRLRKICHRTKYPHQNTYSSLLLTETAKKNFFFYNNNQKNFTKS